MSIVPWNSDADEQLSLSDEFFNLHNQLLQHHFNLAPFSSFPIPSISPALCTLPLSELAIETDGSFNSRLQCKETPEAYLLVADLPPAVEKNKVVVQADDSAPGLRISGEGGWGRFNWRMKLPANTWIDQLASDPSAIR